MEGLGSVIRFNILGRSYPNLFLRVPGFVGGICYVET